MNGLTAANVFVAEAGRRLSPSLRSVILAGSYARGEATVESDLDLWCVFSVLESAHLQAVGEIVRQVSQAHGLEVNPQVVTEDEFRRFRAFGTVLTVLEGSPLFGAMPVAAPPTAEVRSACEALLGETLLSARHYLAVAEPSARLADGRVRKWVLKPLSYGLRLERFLCAGTFPLRGQDLLQELPGQAARQSMTWFTRPDQLRFDLEQDGNGVLQTILRAAGEALTQIEAG